MRRPLHINDCFFIIIKLPQSPRDDFDIRPNYDDLEDNDFGTTGVSGLDRERQRDRDRDRDNDYDTRSDDGGPTDDPSDGCGSGDLTYEKVSTKTAFDCS